MNKIVNIIIAFLILTGTASAGLVVSEDNPRYFEDDGEIVYLAGSHTWYNLQPWDDRPCDIDEYINLLQQNNHNYVRGWTVKSLSVPWGEGHKVMTFPYNRTGPGEAVDGLPKFDVTQFNQSHFDEIRNRVIALDEAGIYVSVMMDWGIIKYPHIYHAGNNINGIDGTVENVFNLDIMPTKILQLHEDSTYKIVKTLGDLDNVFWEVGNELHEDSYTYQEHMITVIRAAEIEYGYDEKPIGITAIMGNWGTAAGDAVVNTEMFNSNADWVSPKDTVRVSGYHPDGYAYDPPINTGDKVVLSDTDHLRDINLPRNCEHELYLQWAWKSFLRGHNIMMMDDPGDIDPTHLAHLVASESRHYVGEVRSYAERIDLVNVTPSETVSNSGYCLYGNGEYITFQTHSAGTEITLNMVPGTYDYEWFDTKTACILGTGIVECSGTSTFKSPIDYGAVLYLKSVDPLQIPATIPQDGMSIIYVDSEELIKTHAPASHAIDNIKATQWHTEWTLGTGHPHEIQLDLGADCTLSGFQYLPRQDDGSGCYNGDIKDYEFYTSVDANQWELVAKDAFSKTKDIHTVYFNPVECRYVKLIALSEINGKRWTTIAELTVLGTIDVPVDPVIPDTQVVTLDHFNTRMDSVDSKLLSIEAILTDILSVLKTVF